MYLSKLFGALAVRFNKLITSVGYLTGRTKLNCSQQISIICILLVLKSIQHNRWLIFGIVTVTCVSNTRQI